MQLNYEQGNRDIMDFLGLDPSYHVQDYHLDWNLLMPIVEQIQKTSVTLPEEYLKKLHRMFVPPFMVELNIMFDERKEFNGWVSRVETVVAPCTIYDSLARHDEPVMFDRMIDAIWQCVHQFVLWYNETQVK